MFIQLINAEESAKKWIEHHGTPHESATALAQYLWVMTFQVSLAMLMRLILNF